jgi:hypothetical protein
MNAAIDINNVMPFLLSLLGGGVGVVLLAQVIKKLFGMNSDKAIHTMVLLVSGVVAIASYILNFKSLPVSVLGVSGPAIYGFSQGVYKTAKALGDLLPNVSAVLHKQSPAAAGAADQVMAAMNAPADVAAEPASTPPNGFNS